MIWALLLLAGCVLILLGNIGLFRLPDFFCRVHALSKAMLLGCVLILASAWLHFGTSAIGAKVGVTMIFLFVTLPLSSHLLSHVAYRKNIRRWRHQPVDRQKPRRTRAVNDTQ
jgi:multicomponent Na+:H+ antiporter subunit G